MYDLRSAKVLCDGIFDCVDNGRHYVKISCFNVVW